MRGHSEKVAISTPRRGASEETKHSYLNVRLLASKCEKIHSCRLNHLVCGSELWLPKLVNIPAVSSFVTSAVCDFGFDFCLKY